MKLHCKLLAGAVALATAGSANALQGPAAGVNATTSSSSLFLYVFEDRGLNSGATNTAIFDLGNTGPNTGVLAGTFDTASAQTWDFSNDSAWTNYVSTIGNFANIKWGVFGDVGNGSGAKNQYLLSTFSILPTAINGSDMGTAASHVANNLLTEYGTSCVTCGSNVANSLNDAAGGNWGNMGGITSGQAGFWTTGLDNSMVFYMDKLPGSGVVNGNTNGIVSGFNGFMFTLSDAGVLNYAPVPEADTYAMMLAGLGLIGFVVRRRVA